MFAKLQKLNIPIGVLQGWLSMKFFTGEYRKFPELVERFGSCEPVMVATTPDKLYINGMEAMSAVGMFRFALPYEWAEEICAMCYEEVAGVHHDKYKEVSVYLCGSCMSELKEML